MISQQPRKRPVLYKWPNIQYKNMFTVIVVNKGTVYNSLIKVFHMLYLVG